MTGRVNRPIRGRRGVNMYVVVHRIDSHKADLIYIEQHFLCFFLINHSINQSINQIFSIFNVIMDENYK